LITPILNEITKTYQSKKAFIGVLFEEDTFEIRFSSLRNIDITRFSAQDIEASDGTRFSVKMNYTEGPSIVAGVATVKKEITSKKEKATASIKGGDKVTNVKLGVYGTIGLFITRVKFIVNGRNGKKTCTTANALISNNHVIARSDKGKAGELMKTDSIADLATLQCYIPLKIQADLDYAAATVKAAHIDKVRWWYIKGIGEINKRFLTPKKNDVIKKWGAATELKQGTVTGKGNIKSGGYWYYGVYIASRGFGCYGDSGAVVVNSNNDILGMWSWLDKGGCTSNPKSYFYTFNIKKRGAGTTETTIDVEKQAAVNKKLNF
jgi:hypothetical protein